MRLGINGTVLNETPTGLGVFINETAKEVCKQHEDTLLFSSFTKSGGCKENTIKTPSKIRGGSFLLNNIFRAIYLNTDFRSVLQKNRIDVLYTPFLEYPFTRNIPIVATILDFHPLMFPKQFGLSSVYFRFSLSIAHLFIKRVIVISEYVKKEMSRFSRINKESVDVVYLSYNKKLFTPENIKRDFCLKKNIFKPYILYVGNLFPYKNVDSLINAFLDIKSLIPHTLVIAGNRQHYQGKLPEHERILYINYTEESDLPSLYGNADLLVHPSLSEGFGITLLEAMACGIPVVTSNRTSIPEVVGDAAVLIDPLDIHEMAKALLGVLRNNSLRKELIEKGKKRADTFSWEGTAKGIIESCKKAFEESN